MDKLDHLSLSEEDIDRKNKKVRKNRPISSAHADVVGKTEAEEEKDERRVPPHEEGLRGAEDGSSESRNVNISVDQIPLLLTLQIGNLVYLSKAPQIC